MDGAFTGLSRLRFFCFEQVRIEDSGAILVSKHGAMRDVFLVVEMVGFSFEFWTIRPNIGLAIASSLVEAK